MTADTRLACKAVDAAASFRSVTRWGASGLRDPHRDDDYFRTSPHSYIQHMQGAKN